MTNARFDIHQHVTDTIVAQIEAGTPPWRQPWTGGKSGACLPVRHNGEAYRGINILMLWATAAQRSYTSERWMTFRQAQALGGKVMKGAKAAKSVFYGTLEKDEDDPSEGEDRKRIPYAKFNNVFNADQIEGLRDVYYIHPDPARDLGTEADPELEAFFAGTGATILIGDEPRSFYRPSTDSIHMPPVGTFLDAAGYYGTLAHELTHWTGAEKRLDRIRKYADRKAYAFEELVAEIGNCMLCVRLGLTPDFAQSAAYIEGWLAALRSDKGMIFKAASEAQKAVDYVMAIAASIEIKEQTAA